MPTKFAYILAPADRAWWWYYDQTAEQVGQLLTQNKAMLTNMSTYLDDHNNWKFAVIMEPASTTWWWYYGQTAEQVGQLLAQNKAMLTDISPYIDDDHILKFVVIMVPADREWWWYVGVSGSQVSQLLAQNNAMPSRIRVYVDVVKRQRESVVIMERTDQKRWWGADILVEGVIEGQHGGTFTDLYAYRGVEDSVLYAFIADASQPTPSDLWGEVSDADVLASKLRENPHVRLSVLSPYVVPNYVP